MQFMEMDVQTDGWTAGRATDGWMNFCMFVCLVR